MEPPSNVKRLLVGKRIYINFGFYIVVDLRLIRKTTKENKKTKTLANERKQIYRHHNYAKFRYRSRAKFLGSFL